MLFGGLYAFLNFFIAETVAVCATAYLLPGVHVTSFGNAIIVAIVMGIANALVLPVLLFITFPINFLTLGLFTFVVMVGYGSC